MAQGKEIKLNKQIFDNEISKLTSYKNNLIKTNNNFDKANTNLKKKWLGDGGTAFILSANVLKANFLKMTQELQEEINDLRSAKISMFGLDSSLAHSITEAILGPAIGGIEVAASTVAKQEK
ncbi:hypothetical protein HBE96_15795 [Clostridium sp. P21]|uniref:WXG100 family type VII secretion target n=1 Tax=Clostridium muellerianum TaxID=2716538 RepID=A0A7Y0EIJ3_9CLOT|nr:hypothetical protein [Clostridium muellerianum]NMM64104.1 hypothetical protein [Clostridium muellerianum]